jgi:hypothetical protein
VSPSTHTKSHPEQQKHTNARTQEKAAAAQAAAAVQALQSKIQAPRKGRTPIKTSACVRACIGGGCSRGVGLSNVDHLSWPSSSLTVNRPITLYIGIRDGTAQRRRNYQKGAQAKRDVLFNKARFAGAGTGAGAGATPAAAGRRSSVGSSTKCKKVRFFGIWGVCVWMDGWVDGVRLTNVCVLDVWKHNSRRPPSEQSSGRRKRRRRRRRR